MSGHPWTPRSDQLGERQTCSDLGKQKPLVFFSEYDYNGRMTTGTDTEPRTINCATGSAHGDCKGYVAPLVYGGSRPCHCSCHEIPNGNPRDYGKAAEMAERSFHGTAGQETAHARIDGRA